MSYLISLFLSILLVVNTSSKFAIGIHGGAIDAPRKEISKEYEIEMKQGLKEAIRAGYEVLKAGGKHLDAVVASLKVLENNPIFDSGVGGKITQKFECELDASIMDGRDRSCGAVAGIKRIKNPIEGAKLIMETTRHVLLIGDAADKYAEKKGLTMVPNKYFMTQDMIKEWYDVRNKGKIPSRHETCGAVALDSENDLAAGTTTGGITNKMAGRIGDSPIIGAGTYADNKTCAVSCTGLGENMIRHSLAYDVRARMLYKKLNLTQAADEAMQILEDKTGGFISLDNQGNFYAPFNSAGLARAWVNESGIAKIILYSEKEDLTPIEYNLEE